jgi:DNA-binding transcriptional LysR family regulator
MSWSMSMSPFLELYAPARQAGGWTTCNPLVRKCTPMSSLNWDDLRFVLAVHRAGSLVAAGKLLAVDKATVSRRVSALESALAVRLFDRRPEGYVLTPHGERVVAAVGDIESSVLALETDLAEARGDRTGVVLLSVPQFFASQVLLPALPAFRASHPGIELVLNASSALVNLAQREAEVGLRNVKPDQRSVTSRRVGLLGMALYASRDYLAARGEPETQADLARHDLVGWDRAVTFAPAFGWVNGLGARVAVRVNDAAVMGDAAAAGLGVAELPCLLGDHRDGLVRLETFGKSVEEIYAVAPGELRRAGRTRAVIELLVTLFSTNQARLLGR